MANVPPNPKQSPLAYTSVRERLEKQATLLIERNGGLDPRKIARNQRRRARRQAAQIG